MAKNVSDKEYSVECIVPSLDDIRSVSCAIAREVVINASKQGRCHAFGDQKQQPAVQLMEKAIAKFSHYPFLDQ